MGPARLEGTARVNSQVHDTPGFPRFLNAPVGSVLHTFQLRVDELANRML